MVLPPYFYSLYFHSQVVAHNNSILNKAAVKVWQLVEDARPVQLETIVDTLTKEETQKLHHNCSGCQADDDICECTFFGIRSENTFNVHLMIADKGLSSKWCPSSTVTSNFFQCDESQSISSEMLCDGFPVHSVAKCQGYE